MAADKSLLVSALVRLAKQQEDPSSWLTGLLGNLATFVTGADGRIRIGSSTGGSSASWTLFDGMTPADAMAIVELALQKFDTGIDVPITVDQDGNITAVPNITQLDNSKRTTSYAQFGNVQH